MSELFNTYNKYDKAVTATKVRIFCRISFAHLWEAKSFLGGDPKYSASCLIDKNDTVAIEMIKKAIEVAKEEGKTKCWGGKVPTGQSFKIPLRDGDAERGDDENYAGQFFINASSKEAPEIINQKKQPITDPMEVGSGDYCMVTINFYPFNANGASKGIAAGLSNVQLAAHGERLSGKASANADFDEIPDMDPLEEGLPDFLK